MYNVAMTGFADSYPVTIFLKDENGEIMGGVLGHICWREFPSIAARGKTGILLGVDTAASFI